MMDRGEMALALASLPRGGLPVAPSVKDYRLTPGIVGESDSTVRTQFSVLISLFCIFFSNMGLCITVLAE